MLAHVVLDYRVLAAEPVLRPQTLIDALGGVALLFAMTPVLLQDPVDHPAVRVQLGSSRRPLRRYPGGSKFLSILRIVSRCISNTLDSSRMLIPFTMHARRTRAYSSTLYILHTFQHVSQNMLEVCGWSSFQAPNSALFPASPVRFYSAVYTRTCQICSPQTEQNREPLCFMPLARQPH